MTTSALIHLLKEKFGEKITRYQEPHHGAVIGTVAPANLVEIARFIFQELHARFVIASGTDDRPISKQFLVDYVYSLQNDHIWLVLRTYADGNAPRLPSITPEVPAATWAEREVQDMLGITIENHPDGRRLVLPDDWPDGLYPLRRDFAADAHPPSDFSYKPLMNPPPEGASVVPIGPFFPVLEEPAYFRLFVEGEEVVGCDYRGFYNHRGIEKVGDSKLNYNQIPFIAERICGI
ncbi:NADH-quinone oxidoreductase subunit C [candidate division KSB1 bacterium]|nr:NADH-quinone oxidoreductase subunit C [candidate division KSB1 bacterium]